MEELDVHNQDGQKTYQQITFTEKGYEILKNYLFELVKIYRDELTLYPFKQGLVLGLPQMKATQLIVSKDELFGRIKCLMMILGLNSIESKLANGSKIVYQIGDSQ